jgi:hypothetical protein
MEPWNAADLLRELFSAPAAAVGAAWVAAAVFAVARCLR